MHVSWYIHVSSRCTTACNRYTTAVAQQARAVKYGPGFFMRRIRPWILLPRVLLSSNGRTLGPWPVYWWIGKVTKWRIRRLPVDTPTNIAQPYTKGYACTMVFKLAAPLIIALSISLVLPGDAHAQLYKGTDAEGNVVYSDTPFQDSESFTPPPLSVMDAPKIEKPQPASQAPEEEEKPETSYSRFAILSPSSGETIWNNPDLAIKMIIEPALATKEGHRIWLLMDGRPVVRHSGSPIVQIGQTYRGTHTFEGQVRNQKGEILKRTPPTQVFIKQTSIRKQAR